MLRLRTDRLYASARKAGDGEEVAAIAERAGIHKSTLHRLLTGQQPPSLQTVWALARAYGLRLDSLVTDDASPEPTATDPPADAVGRRIPKQRHRASTK
jgi:transcriptional regulator with XRE-family HTH domain